METTERTVTSTAESSGNKKRFTFTAEESQLSFKPSDKNITVMCSGGAHDRGSSKIKLINVINFKWEVKHYPGRLIACHKECELVAYAITVTKLSKSEGMVRVAHLKVPERGLIKGLSSEVLDIQFAHTSNPDYLLGIIERTTLQVHQVLVKSGKVSTVLKVKIVDPLDGHVPVCDRINWCPYLRENGYEIDDFASQLLVWTRGSTFQCYSISTLTKTYIDPTDLKASDIDEGGFKASDGDATIIGSVYSADGTILALSSSDGEIRFYQVYQHSNDCIPRRLYQWQPHDGRPVSAFFFLDNYTETVDEKELWKHAITCADNNTEIKVWCCESWQCLQTIRLESPMEQPLNFKAEIDLTSTYLVLSDMNTRQVYVLQIRKGQSVGSALPSPASSSQDPEQATEAQWKSRTASLARGKVIRKAEQSAVKAYIVSIAEYPVSTMILGFGILYARMGNYLMREQDEDDEDQSLPSCIAIRMFLVQSGSFQDCTLMYDAVEESECDVPAAIGEEPGVIDCEADSNETRTSHSSSASSESSNETTDNNLSHPPSEASDRSLERKGASALMAASVAKKAGEDSSDGTNSGSTSSNNDSRDDDDGEEDEAAEDDGARAITNDLLKLKMAEATQKLSEAIEALSPVNSSADAGSNTAGGTSGPNTPASATKVNLMTPESFSTPSGRGSRSAKDSSSATLPLKDVRIINLSELPYPEVETIMSQFDRRRSRGRGRVAPVIPTTTTTTTTCSIAATNVADGTRKNNSSVTSTASASSGGRSGSETSEEDEGGAGGNNTSVASIAGSERVANITDDPDDEDDNGEEADQQEGVAKGKERNARSAGLANGAAGDGGLSSSEPAKKKVHGNVLNVSSTLLSVEHFTKILTLDEAEAPSVREKNKSDETVNPNVLSTLFMLANATKQQQQHQLHRQQTSATVVEMVSSSSVGLNAAPGGTSAPPAPSALQAFVDMVNSRAANEEANSKQAASSKLRKSANNGPAMAATEGGSVSVPPEVPPMPSADVLASGGSSPSREVQEIMSTKGSGINMMVDDLFQFMCTPGHEKMDLYDDEDEDDDDEEKVETDTRVAPDDGLTGINRFDEEDGVVVVTANGTDDTLDDALDGKEKGTGSVVVDEDAPSTEDKKAVANASVSLGGGGVVEQAANMKPPNKSTAVEEVAAASGVVAVAVEEKPVASFWPSKVPTEVPDSSPLEVKSSVKRSSMPTTSGPPSVPLPVATADSTKQIEALTNKMDRMMELMLVQSRQLEEMTGQFEAIRKAKAEDQRRLSSLVNRIQQTLPKTIETQLTGCLAQHSAKLEQTILACSKNQQAQLVEALTRALTTSLMMHLPDRLGAVLLHELHQTLLPPISQKVDVMQRTLSLDIAGKLRATENSMRDAIQQSIQSEPIISTLSASVQTGLRVVIKKIYEDSLRTVILPGYDKCNQEMFRQLNLAFSEGIKQFIRKIDSHIVRATRTHDRTNELVDVIRQLPEKVAANGERTTATAVRAIRENIEKDLKVLQTPLLKTIRDHIRQEIEKGFEAQASSLEDSVLSVVRSQAQTPAPSNMDVQEQIKQYLNGGQINKAFHKALLSNDLSLVEFLLERADHKQVFNPCPLEQTVLLSLIQQISADMPNHNDLKHKYLSDAIVSLDFHDAITKEHSPKVMLELITNCQAFMAANPSSSLCTSLKMLIIAVQYMGFKQF